MADKANKFPDNAPGPYFVDDQCIACDACVNEAPGHFAMNDEEGHAYVMKQPETEAEKAACEAAKEGCPVDAIGNDG
jgi:ferredoxin